MKKTVLFIGFVYPEPRSSAAGSRSLQLMDIFLAQNCRVVFATSSKVSDRTFDLESIGIEVVKIKLNHNSFDDFIKQLQPSYVVFDRFMTEEQFGWRVAETCPDALRILDTQDLHFLRKGRQEALKNNSEFLEDQLKNSITVREVASIYRSDLTLIISEFEMDLLLNQFHVNSSILYYLPFLIESNSLNQTTKAFSNRLDFVSIGNFLHAPNSDAVHALKHHIWPLIRQQLPESKLHIYGAYPKEDTFRLEDKTQGFMVHGYTDQALERIEEAKLLLAPLRFGAGLKGKLIDAMRAGTPSVMTPIAAEGLFGKLPPNGPITADWENFAQKAVELYGNQNMWLTYQNNGYQILNNRFSKFKFVPAFVYRINELTSCLPSHRLKNFIGKMLLHHSLQSTKFLAKWIEQKNRSI